MHVLKKTSMHIVAPRFRTVGIQIKETRMAKMKRGKEDIKEAKCYTNEPDAEDMGRRLLVALPLSKVHTNYIQFQSLGGGRSPKVCLS